LRQLKRYYPAQSLRIIPGRAEQLRGHAVDTVIREAEGRLMLMPQPAYSPELHPQERLWKWLRRIVTHKPWLAPDKRQSTRCATSFVLLLAGKPRSGGCVRSKPRRLSLHHCRDKEAAGKVSDKEAASLELKV
jgi:hypothetical protein